MLSGARRLALGSARRPILWQVAVWRWHRVGRARRMWHPRVRIGPPRLAAPALLRSSWRCCASRPPGPLFVAIVASPRKGWPVPDMQWPAGGRASCRRGYLRWSHGSSRILRPSADRLSLHCCPLRLLQAPMGRAAKGGASSGRPHYGCEGGNPRTTFFTVTARSAGASACVPHSAAYTRGRCFDLSCERCGASEVKLSMIITGRRIDGSVFVELSSMRRPHTVKSTSRLQCSASQSLSQYTLCARSSRS